MEAEGFVAVGDEATTNAGMGTNAIHCGDQISQKSIHLSNRSWYFLFVWSSLVINSSRRLYSIEGKFDVV